MRHRAPHVRLARAAALLAVLASSLFSPRQAPAQILPQPGSLVVTITSPASGSTVSGTITVSASVSPLGLLVAGVQFKVDGFNLGMEDTTAPYSVPWNTASVSNGSHTLTAVARDALGLRFTSDPVTVTVSNADTTLPWVTITSPASGSTVSGTITVTATALDKGGVAGVQFRLDGSSLGAEDRTAPYSVAWDTRTATNGSHTLRAVARDLAGNVGTSSSVTVTVSNAPPPDTTPPSVTITSPASGSTVMGTVTVSASASDNVGVTGVQFQLDGSSLGAEDTTAPYSVAWDTWISANGSHTLTAVARDAAGNRTTSSPATVTVSNDHTAPTVSMTSPASGSTVSGTVTVSASASDNVGVVLVKFTLDAGQVWIREDTEAPYSVEWDTTIVSDGAHTLRAEARDAAGNRTTSTQVSVTVSNAPPPDTTPPTVSITSPASGSTVQGSVTVTASASDNVGVAGVQFMLDGDNLGAEDTTAPYSVAWDTTTASNGPHDLTAVARDAAGNRTTSTQVSVTVSNAPPPDTTPPSVSITSPASGSTVSGSVSVTASASDNVGVAGVQFMLDGVTNLGAEDTTAPYSVAWDTTTASNGSHSLTAVARDAAGNRTTSTPVSVTVDNAAPPPAAGGDIFLSMRDGTVQWRNPDGTLRQVLTSVSDGPANGMAFDAAGNLYVTLWAGTTTPGNTVARFDTQGRLLGTFGSGYNANPESIVFDSQGNAYVGQADDTQDILMFDPSGTLVTAFDVAIEHRGSDWVEIAPDGCTLLYTSREKNVLQFDACTNTQLANFNAQPLPGDNAFALRMLPDGGLLVADTSAIVRLDASGAQVQTYDVVEEFNSWIGLDLGGDGTFWASNFGSSGVYRFDIATGEVLASFNTGTPIGTVDAVAVRK